MIFDYSRPTVILLDTSALMHRAYHAVKFSPIYNKIPVGMVYGFTSILLQLYQNLLSTNIPLYFCAALDSKEKTFRHKIDITYKAHRPKTPQDFFSQVPYVLEMLHNFGIQTIASPGFEADDIIGTLSVEASKQNLSSQIISHDLDFLQLVNDNTVLVKLENKIINIYDSQKVEERFGLYPNQMKDYKAIVGDSSDNYKGIPGIGTKTATKLLQEYKTLECILEERNKLPEKIKEKFKTYESEVLHCQFLAKIKTDMNLDFVFNKDNQYKLLTEKVTKILEHMNFTRLSHKWNKIITSSTYNIDKNKPEQQSLF